MNPEEIASKDFPVVMRGYVREEVHAFLAAVAGQLAERDARIAALETELAGGRRRAPATGDGLDRAELLRHLGEEAASILTCADATAERMKAQAGIATQRVRSDLARIGTGLVDVHGLLGELVSLVQSLTEESAVLAGSEITLPEAEPAARATDRPRGGDEVRTVLGEVLGLDHEEREVRIPEEEEVPGNPS